MNSAEKRIVDASGDCHMSTHFTRKGWLVAAPLVGFLLTGCSEPASVWCANWRARVHATKECSRMANCRVEPIDLERIAAFDLRCENVELKP